MSNFGYFDCDKCGTKMVVTTGGRQCPKCPTAMIYYPAPAPAAPLGAVEALDLGAAHQIVGEAIDRLGIDRSHSLTCDRNPCTCSGYAEDEKDSRVIAKLWDLKKALRAALSAVPVADKQEREAEIREAIRIYTLNVIRWENCRDQTNKGAYSDWVTATRNAVVALAMNPAAVPVDPAPQGLAPDSPALVEMMSRMSSVPPKASPVVPPVVPPVVETSEEVKHLQDEVASLRRKINSPEIADFVSAIQNEAVHQRERWGTQNDEGKSAEDWLWLIAYLTTKAAQASRYGDDAKYLHHIVTTGAACLNWHANVTRKNVDMKPGAPAPSTPVPAPKEGDQP